MWINYALYEELEAEDADRAAKVYKACLGVIPHGSFSFAKIWVLAAKNHIRRQDLDAARKTMGRAIGMCGKESVFREYIGFELALGEVDRCRALYGKYLEAYPSNCEAWRKYGELEASVGETDRARALLELAVAQQELDMPEVLWKAFIDFEIEQGEGAKARELFARLLEKVRDSESVRARLRDFYAPLSLGTSIREVAAANPAASFARRRPATSRSGSRTRTSRRRWSGKASTPPGALTRRLTRGSRRRT